jgi:PKD repeat protein
MKRLRVALCLLLLPSLSCDRDPVSPNPGRPKVARPLAAYTLLDGPIALTDLGHLGAAPSRARRITDFGTVVGTSAIPGGESRGFTYRRSDVTMTEVGFGYRPGDWIGTEVVDGGNHLLGGVRLASGAWRAAWLESDVEEWHLMPLLPGGTSSHVVGWSGSDIAGTTELGAITRATLWAASSPPGAAWVPTDLGTLGGASSEARDVNASRQIVGRAQRGDGAWRPFVWDGGGMRELAVLDGHAAGAANGVSDGGLVVGWTGEDERSKHGVVWEGGAAALLPTAPDGGAASEALAVNADGDVVGWSASADGTAPRPVIWRRVAGAWSVRELGTLGGASGLAVDVNKYGVIVGESETASGEVHATRWTLPPAADAIVPLPVFDERFDDSDAIAVDADGVVYGTIDTVDYFGGGERRKRVVAWPATGVTRLFDEENRSMFGASSDFQWFVGAQFSWDDPYVWSSARVWRRDGASWWLGPKEARAVNRSGVVVGYRRYPETTRADSTIASVWTESGGSRLLPYPAEDSGRPWCAASDVNDSGTIVGYCQGGGTTRPMVWSAVDASVADMSAALGLRCGQLEMITESGEMIGYACDDGRTGPFRWSAEAGLRLLPLPAGAGFPRVRDVNVWGDVVGEFSANGRRYGVLWPAGGEGLILLPDAFLGASAIGDGGHVAGTIAVAQVFRTARRAGWLSPLVPRGAAPPRANQPPVASAGGPYSGVTGAPVAPNAGASVDPDGDALSYWWDFGDGGLGTGAAPTHAYVDAGEYTATLEVHDALGAVARATATVTVAQAPGSPVAVVNGPYTGSEGVGVSFSAAGSSDPAGGALTYLWSFGDGTTATGVAPTHVYANDGTYQVSLRVTNAGGGASARSWTTATIANAPPTLKTVMTDLTGALRDSLPVELGRTVGINAGYSDAGLAEVVTVRFDWGDGTVVEREEIAEGANVIRYRGDSHAYAGLGRYPVVVTVRDDAGAEASRRLVIDVVDDRPPASDPGASYTVDEGAPFQLDGTGSRDPEGGPLTYEWAFQSGMVRLSGPRPTYTFSDQQAAWGAAYDPNWVYLVVTDQRGLQARARADVFVRNVAPTVALSASSPTPSVGGTFSLGLTFRDPGVQDSPWDYVVDWGDGTATSAGRFSFLTGVSNAVQGTQTIAHSYSATGTYTISVTVRDKDGGTGLAQATVTPTDRPPPTVVHDGPFAGSEGRAVSFDASASRAADGGALTYRWDFGDGTSAATATASHVYADQGSYAVTLRVTDAEGITSLASTTATVSNAPPGVVIRAPGSAATLLPGQVLTLDARFSDDGAADGPWSWSVSWGDGSSAAVGTAPTTVTAIAASHVYAAAGSYAVTVSVRDKDLGTGTRQLAVTVRADGQLPIASAGGPYAANEGTSIAFTSAGSSDPDGGSLTYKWDFGDGTTSTSANPTKKYADNGNFAVTLTVKAPTGLASTASTMATIANVAPTAKVATTSSVPEGQIFGLSLSAPTDPSSPDQAAGFAFAHDCADGQGYRPWSSAIYVECPGYPDNVPSTRTLRAKLRDKDGGEREYSQPITVNSAAPVVAPLALVTPTGAGGGATSTDPVRLRSGDAASVTGRFTDQGLLDAPWAIKWAWDDGTSGTGSTGAQGETLSAAHTFYKVGTFKVYLQVTDKDAKYGRSAYLYVRVDSLPVSIDVLPGASPNVIDLDLAAHATVQVAILSTPTLDATKLGSLRLGNGSGSEASTSASGVQRDVDGDGRLDLVASFSRSTLVSNGDLTTSTTQLVLIGTHADGRKVRGTDAVQVVP